MHTFQELLRKIREESRLTQEELARVLNVSTVLISMMESGQKQASKAFIMKLAEKMGVRPTTITPFLLSDDAPMPRSLANPERALIRLGEKLQVFLIKKRSANLRKYV